MKVLSTRSRAEKSSIDDNKNNQSNGIFALIVISLSAIIVGVGATTILPTDQAITLGLLVFCAALWATGKVPEFWPAIFLFVFATITNLAPNTVIFSGFESSTYWLLFSGMVFGAAIKHTGLNLRAAGLLGKLVGTTYKGIVTRSALFGLMLAFLIPSGIGRIVLLIPIVVAIIDQLGYEKDSNGRYGILLAAAFGTFLPTFSILPANAPNMLLSGMSEALYSTTFSYWDYLVLHFPVLGLGKVLVTIALILFLFPSHDPKNALPERNIATLSTKEKQLLVVLTLCFLMWLTDGIHGISSGWVGLAACAICLFPKADLTSKQCLNKDIQYTTLLFAAGIIGLGAIIAFTGLGESLVNLLTQVAPFSDASLIYNLGLVTGISTIVGIVTNLAGVPAIITPLAEHLADITGLSTEAILMSEVMAFSSVLLPYQAPPLITAVALGKLPIGVVTKLCLATFLITVLILLPINFVWWDVLGII
ncbi:SLC13 family permease [Marinomonas mediterranea]|jgi:Di- and tricarboxylate transporters|uniref:Citrate transporter n=1 Tax=Marinomonas mediterranea (strain ATCC 700492 / JCM 21426 / NBRC 103028 / MMB-1) TaxID=717774 RepID=F2JUV7_MARM1|nr:SLC13 family permease [Marinomonas mediterranea]ADZ90522.1 Citrate transporter [Marinomonas mediterranea MMB-1]WCN16701.1 sodium:sulfate symporter [Marinomonas mediterranea MMB-1]